ncbi:MAG: 5-oxoprolinase subunit PxpA [Chitinophagaceae bacterium]
MGIDINCDMGEGIGNDELIMPFISSANIACGYHAGDPETIWKTVELAAKYQVAVGAHVSFLDRAGFGRNEMQLPVDDLYDLVTQQLLLFEEITGSLGQKINHVKPHGALYNMSAKDALTANVIAKAIRDVDPAMILFGLSGSHSIEQAKAVGLKTASEVFADRAYQDNGSLTPRSQPGALIVATNKAVEQVLQMIQKKTVTTISGKTIPIDAETVCIHGDGKQAVEFARAIHEALRKG